jgi:transposase
MVKTRRRKRSSRRQLYLVAKRSGVVHPRVQKVGPEHFGIVAVDCAKARSKWMLADFYGKAIIPPTVVEHKRADLQAAVARVRQAMRSHGLRDILTAVERTGRYHQPVQRAFADAGFDVRVVHPFATKQFRQPANPGNKTDDTDLAAIHRSAVNGFALLEMPLEKEWVELRLLTRHRRDLVRKAATLQCQIREHLQAAMPGYAACFADFWVSQVALRLVRQVGLAADLRWAGLEGLARVMSQEGVRFQRRSLQRVLAWAREAAAPATGAEQHRVIALALDDDHLGKKREIQDLERQIAARLVRTPYVVLLSICGINVVSAAEYAGEMGPIGRYANPKTITGRAGLFPSRYQSDDLDLADGPLVRCANRGLRFAILQIADNLIACNRHFRRLSEHWKAAGKDPRHTRVRVASRFARISFHMVMNRSVFRHPIAADRDFLVQKLMDFHRAHGSSTEQLLSDAQAAIRQLQRRDYAAEAQPVADALRRIQERRSRGPQPIGEILPVVLAQLGVVPVQSRESGDRDPA